MTTQQPKETTTVAACPTLSAGLERLRVAAGIELEDSFEAGSKWEVGDKELSELVRLAKKEEREEIAEMVDERGVCSLHRFAFSQLANDILARSN